MKRWLVVIAALASCGGTQQPAPAEPAPPVAQPAPPLPAAPPPTPPPKPITRREQMMQDLAALTDEMCACKPGDRACALRVQQKLSDFGQDNDDLADVQMPDADKARAAELGKRMTACSAAALQSEFLTAVMRFKDEVCACTDASCVKRVGDDMKAYADAHPEMAHAKVTDAEEKLAAQLARQAGACAARAGQASAP